MRPSRSAGVVASLVITAISFSGCGSSKKTTDTTAKTADTVATTEAAAAPGTEPVTEALTTEAAAAAATEAAATEAAAAASSVAPASGGDPVSGAIVAQMLSGMANGATADPADIKCVTEKIKSEDLAKLVSAGGAAPDPTALKGIIKAAFQCKPKGLSDSLIKSAFADMPADVTATQKKCIADKFLDTILSDDAILDAMLANSANPPESIKAKFEPIVTDCVPAGATRDILLKDIRKS